jgi:hypothetical protein
VGFFWSMIWLTPLSSLAMHLGQMEEEILEAPASWELYLACLQEVELSVTS